jgi:hypothetical protein
MTILLVSATNCSNFEIRKERAVSEIYTDPISRIYFVPILYPGAGLAMIQTAFIDGGERIEIESNPKHKDAALGMPTSRLRRLDRWPGPPC